jgi:uncharacterized membrane protein
LTLLTFLAHGCTRGILKRGMFWLQRRQLHAFLKNSLWVVPVLSMLAALIWAPVSRYWNSTVDFRFFNFGLQGARAAVGMIAGSMLTFVVFFFSVLLLTVQIASGTLSPRIIARPFQSRVLKASLGLFVFTFIYGLAVLGRLEDRVLEMPVFVTVLLSIASIGVFLFVVEYVGKQLRPATVVASVGREGLQVIRAMYPLPWSGTLQTEAPALPKAGARRTIPHHGPSGVVVAYHLDRLFALAVRHDCIIELVPQVGDYVPDGGTLLRIHGCGDGIRIRELRNAILLGRERTLEQDPGFAFRIIVDIAEKALSPAINDPTTGVLAIDQLQYLLQEIGQRDLSTGAMLDADRQIRVVYRTPNWGDFVSLAVSEIRHYGGGSVQVMRRLRSMLEGLIAVLPPARAPFLQEQLDLLRASIEKSFDDPRDRIDAAVPDSQGLGAVVPGGSSQ